jgi:hypothetical protein
LKSVLPANVASTLRFITKRLGWGYAFLWVCAKLGRLFSLHIFVITTHPFENGQGTDVNTAGLEARILTRDEVVHFFDQDEGFGYLRAFAADALSRGDRCFGLLEHGCLLWYCWYARGPAPVFDDVEAVADFPFLYGYNAHTDRHHRGRGLHRTGVRASAHVFAREGYRAFTAYIEAHNLQPLIAARAMGERVVGFVVVQRLAGRARSLATRGCRRGGFRLVRSEKPLVRD